MPRGGREYYDPIIQAPAKADSAITRRIELYPEQDVRDNAVSLRWVARLVDASGVVIQKSDGSFDHDGALRQAQELWPGLEVFELREESEDSTWEGMGPSPRLWQHVPPTMGFPGERLPENVVDLPPAGERAETIARLAENVQEQGARALRTIVASDPGAYCHIDDIVVILEEYAVQYDEQGNPSGALALREAAAALSEPF